MNHKRIGRPPTNPTVRFWAYVQKSEGCWEWKGCVSQTGYGRLQIKRRSEEAHRFSWELHCGPIPDGLFVCHHCDNRKCVRPDHLFLGTHQDNMDDKVRKGRQPSGMQLPQTKLRPQDVAAIHDMCKRFPPTRGNGNGILTFLGRWFGVAPAYVSQMYRNQKGRD